MAPTHARFRVTWRRSDRTCTNYIALDLASIPEPACSLERLGPLVTALVIEASKVPSQPKVFPRVSASWLEEVSPAHLATCLRTCGVSRPCTRPTLVSFSSHVAASPPGGTHWNSSNLGKCGSALAVSSLHSRPSGLPKSEKRTGEAGHGGLDPQTRSSGVAQASQEQEARQNSLERSEPWPSAVTVRFFRPFFFDCVFRDLQKQQKAHL